MIDGYLLCATPRTGSTLLCQYLVSTGVAGRPESYFRSEDLAAYAEAWGILRPDGSWDIADYVAATRRAARSDNGVLGVRIMWRSLDETAAALGRLHPDLAGDDRALLERAFGRLGFVHLRREDVLAQAISLYRAERTGYWHVWEGEEPERPPPFDFEAIRSLVGMLERHDAAWRTWFDANGVEPLALRYEDLAADPEGATLRVLDLLGIELPPRVRLKASNRRLADATTRAWIARYERELASRAD